MALIRHALSETEILEIIEGFAFAAKQAQIAGFTGVQIHAAHGYLVNQFLYPHHNRREDKWGGSLENRMRFVGEIYAAIRLIVSAEFVVAIKLNSADFQKGGFSEDDSIAIMSALQSDGINLVEISGGNYENPSMMGGYVKSNTVKREAYFLDFAEKAQKTLTTGIKALDFMPMLNITWYEHQLSFIGHGKSPKPNLNAWISVFKTFSAMGASAFKKRRA